MEAFDSFDEFEETRKIFTPIEVKAGLREETPAEEVPAEEVPAEEPAVEAEPAAEADPAPKRGRKKKEV